MMLPAALHGWAPSFGQWCSFAISSLRWTGCAYAFRAQVESVEPIAVRLELVDRFSRALRGGQDGDVVFRPRANAGLHARPPPAVSEDVVVQDQRPHVRRPEDPLQVGEGVFRVFMRG